MKNIIKTLLIGYIFAIVVEAINMGIGQGLWKEMFLTVILFYGIFILIGYWYSKRTPNNPGKHFVIFGIIGLMFEWFIFGMNPWSGGNIFVVILIQIGMFSHWTTTTFAPRLLLDEEHVDRRFKHGFLTFYSVGMGLVYALGMLTPPYTRWTLMILGNILVYTLLLPWYIKYIKSF
ncbi:hypothetical protein RJG79_11540 [Mycoplasmatota bacterium WC44]